MKFTWIHVVDAECFISDGSTSYSRFYQGFSLRLELKMPMWGKKFGIINRIQILLGRPMLRACFFLHFWAIKRTPYFYHFSVSMAEAAWICFEACLELLWSLLPAWLPLETFSFYHPWSLRSLPGAVALRLLGLKFWQDSKVRKSFGVAGSFESGRSV